MEQYQQPSVISNKISTVADVKMGAIPQLQANPQLQLPQAQPGMYPNPSYFYAPGQSQNSGAVAPVLPTPYSEHQTSVPLSVQLTSLKSALAQKESENQQLSSQLLQKDSIIQQQESLLQQNTVALQQKDSLIQQQAKELETKDSLIQNCQSAIQQRDSLLQQKDSIIQQKESAILQHESTLQQMEGALQQQSNQLQNKESLLQQLAAFTQQQDAFIQQKQSEILQHLSIIQQQAKDLAVKDSLVQQKESVIQKQEESIQEKEAVICQVGNELLEKNSLIQQLQQQSKEREREERMKKIKKKWKELLPEIEEIFKSDFFTNTRNENWKSPEDFEILEPISEGRGSFNVGIFRISCNEGECALKIIQRMVEDSPEEVELMYSNTHIKKLDQSETSIPFVFAFPTIVPLLNYFIGDLKSIKHPLIDQKRQLYEGSNAKLISKTTFLVMPVYDGTLECFWKDVNQKNIAVSLEDQYFVIYQCLLTLEHFKVNRIIHGDFRPANIFIFYKRGNDRDNDYLRIGVGDFGLSKSSAKNLQYIRDEHGNPFNNYYVPPEVRRYRHPKHKKQNFWDVFKGYDCWSLGKSLIELYCVNDKNWKEYSTAMQSESLKSKEEFHAWLEQFVGDRMTVELKSICMILLDVEERKRKVSECLLVLGVHMWVIPELRKELGENWMAAEMEKKKEVVVKLFDTLADGIVELFAANINMQNWREVCRIQWFSKNQLVEDIYAMLTC